MHVLVVGPDRADQGGVANYYNAVFPRLSNDDVTVHYLEIGSTKGKGGIKHIILDQIRYWRTIGKYKPDLIHLNPSLDLKSFLRDGAFIFISKLYSKPVLVFFRGWQAPFEKKVSGKLKWFFNLTYNRADSFIVLAKEFSDRLKEWGVAKPIYIGTTSVADELLNDFSIEKKAASIKAADTIHLLYLARLERDKGIFELIHATKTLLDAGIPISLTIAGDGSIMEQVRVLISSMGSHKDKIQTTGYVRGQDKIDIMSSHHIYCFPTQYGEGMPNSVLEAMAFGMPVVTCPVGGIADFFENNNMGKLLQGNDPDSIVEAIESLVSNTAKLADISNYNYNYAQRRFLASTVSKTLRKYYQDTLQIK